MCCFLRSDPSISCCSHFSFEVVSTKVARCGRDSGLVRERENYDFNNSHVLFSPKNVKSLLVSMKNLTFALKSHCIQRMFFPLFEEQNLPIRRALLKETLS